MYAGFMMNLYWFYDELTMILWWMYVGFMLSLCWFYDEFMLIYDEFMLIYDNMIENIVATV